MKRINKSIIAVLMICLIFIQVLTGCTSKSKTLEQENAKLKQELQASSQKLETVTSELKDVNKQLEDSKQKLKGQETLYELRNTLDSDLHYFLDALISNDFNSAKGYLASSIKIADDKLIVGEGGIEFAIPDRLMNLRQRAYMLGDGKYSAIYEIYDAGYNKGEKYDDRIYTLNVVYVQENGVWKLSNIGIDE